MDELDRDEVDAFREAAPHWPGVLALFHVRGANDYLLNPTVSIVGSASLMPERVWSITGNVEDFRMTCQPVTSASDVTLEDAFSMIRIFDADGFGKHSVLVMQDVGGVLVKKKSEGSAIMLGGVPQSVDEITEHCGFDR
jgi:hypothetical protein